MNMTKTSMLTDGEFDTQSFHNTTLAVPAAPALEAMKKSPRGPFEFRVHLSGEVMYELEVSDDLKNWTPLESGIASVESIVYVDVDAEKFTSRFYRAICDEFISENIIGYASVDLAPGFSMIANPFNARSNAISALFPQMIEGVTLCKFDTNLFRLTNNSVKNKQWTNPNETLVPGEGAIFFNPTDSSKIVEFVGEVSQGCVLNPIPAGLSIRSSVVPKSGGLQSDLGFPIAAGDVVHIFDRVEQKYKLYPFSASGWESSPPLVSVGESFWIAKTQAGNWMTNYPKS